jgi:DNA-binding NarL/FixJ family response regulator
MTTARILVVDDHDIVRQGVCALVTAQAGWEVCGEARSGREALRLAEELRPDIIIMDLLMPDLNGLDAARQIKKHLPSAETVILTGHEDADLIQSVFDAGIRAYIFKSEARTHLVPAITSLLTHKPYLTARVSEVLFRRFEQHSAGGEKLSRADTALTAREREIVQLLSEGRSNKEVASSLAISAKTVETHRASIMRKLNLDSLSDLVRYAIRNKIIEP